LDELSRQAASARQYTRISMQKEIEIFLWTIVGRGADGHRLEI
jgi:hypothetical protein